MKSVKPFARFGALILVAGLSLGTLSGCDKNPSSSSGTGNDNAAQQANLSDDEILDKIAEANPSDVTKTHPAIMNGTMTVKMDVDSFDMETSDMDYVIEQLPDPYRFHMTMKTTNPVDGSDMNIEIYGEENGSDGFTMYMENEGEWHKENISADELQDTLNPSGTTLDITTLRDFIGKENIVIERGANEYTLTIDIPNDKITQLMGDALSKQGLADLAETTFNAYKIVATYDAETFYNTAMDVTTDYTISLTGQEIPVAMRMSGKMDNNPTGLSIEIPEAAKNA